ncbi:MAG: carboxypeptidase-like regulatory domain-containing protein [Raineya sp.]|jgi:hypothetical protein|nr:carboxypeptidase-like regulatory domain-containing protein [Raineya sp.]
MKKLLCLCVSLFLIATIVKAQDEKPVMLSGLIIDKNTKAPIEAARVIVPQAGKGTITNDKGVFTLKVMPNDSLIIRSTGYRTSFYKVPANQKESYSITLPLEESIEMLAPVQVYPYSDEKSFKDAFLSIETQTEETKAMKENLDKGKLQDAARQSAQDSQSASQNQLQNQANQPITNSSLPTINLFSPTAWRDFVKGIKQTKNEKERKEKNYKK